MIEAKDLFGLRKPRQLLFTIFTFSYKNVAFFWLSLVYSYICTWKNENNIFKTVKSENMMIFKQLIVKIENGNIKHISKRE